MKIKGVLCPGIISWDALLRVCTTSFSRIDAARGRAFDDSSIFYIILLQTRLQYMFRLSIRNIRL